MSSSRLCNWCHEETRLEGSVGANKIMPSPRTNSFHGACQYQARKIELDPFGVWSRLEILTADRPTTPVSLAVSILDFEIPIPASNFFFSSLTSGDPWFNVLDSSPPHSSPLLLPTSHRLPFPLQSYRGVKEEPRAQG